MSIGVVNIRTLEDTADMMYSDDYRERFIAEYYQAKIRYEKLKAFNAKIEAGILTEERSYEKCRHIGIPKHDCPMDILRNQQRVMSEYLGVLETRAVIEGIDLTVAVCYTTAVPKEKKDADI